MGPLKSAGSDAYKYALKNTVYTTQNMVTYFIVAYVGSILLLIAVAAAAWAYEIRRRRRRPRRAEMDVNQVPVVVIHRQNPLATHE